MSSVFGCKFSGRCEVCFRDGGEEMDTESVNTTTSVQSNHTSSSVSEFRLGNDTFSGNCGGPSETPLSEPLKLAGIFCSEYCRKRSTLFSYLEEKHQKGLRHVRELIYAKAPHMKDMSTLEMMNMTTRLFFMVISTHRRLIYYHLNRCKHKNGGGDVSKLRKSEDLLQSNGIAKVSTILLDSFADKMQTGIENLVGSASIDSDAGSRGAIRGATSKVLPIELALKLLGVYPLVNDCLSSSERAELIVLYKALTVKFKEEGKKVYTEVLFYSLYNYIKYYFTPAYVSSPSTTVSPTTIQVFGKDGEDTSMPFCINNVYHVYYLPLLLGCAAREPQPSLLPSANCSARAVEREEDGTPKRDERVHVRCHSLSLHSPESTAKANAKFSFIDRRRSLFHSLRRNSRFNAAQISSVSPECPEEGTDDAEGPLFPLLEAISLRSIRRREPLTYLSMPHIGEIH